MRRKASKASKARKEMEGLLEETERNGRREIGWIRSIAEGGRGA